MKAWNLHTLYTVTVIFGKIELHVNSVDSRFIVDTCSVHFMLFVALLPKDMAVKVVVPLFQWESTYIKITISLHVLSHKTYVNGK